MPGADLEIQKQDPTLASLLKDHGHVTGKLFKIGNQAMNARVEAYYNIEKPDSAPDWQWGFTIQFLFPK
jgi:hypothetical protein